MCSSRIYASKHLSFSFRICHKYKIHYKSVTANEKHRKIPVRREKLFHPLNKRVIDVCRFFHSLETFEFSFVFFSPYLRLFFAMNAVLLFCLSACSIASRPKKTLIKYLLLRSASSEVIYLAMSNNEIICSSLQIESCIVPTDDVTKAIEREREKERESKITPANDKTTAITVCVGGRMSMV